MFIVGFTICGETKYKVVGCCYLFVYCEITDYNSKKQEINLIRWGKAGAYCCVAYSLTDVIDLLERIDRGVK